MASICPKCHQELEEDAVCCATIEHTWKCASCGKLAVGPVVPYGRCHLCGGTLDVVDPYPALESEAERVVQDALKFEMEMFQFYRIARRRAGEASQRALFEQLYLKELDHIAEIERKYHVHLQTDYLVTSVEEQDLAAQWIFEGIELGESPWSVRPLYEKAIRMEQRTREYFARRALELPEGREREICRELAAEEEEHVAMLESELALLETETAIGS
ncbi:MAG TPA: hypothetical protein VFP98_06485 [Candidatus Polarisedimenticolia bacterium]|nr:hypothetical protein [Candidatus Polarisedimenticolia bacterium]